MCLLSTTFTSQKIAWSTTEHFNKFLDKVIPLVSNQPVSLSVTEGSLTFVATMARTEPTLKLGTRNTIKVSTWEASPQQHGPSLLSPEACVGRKQSQNLKMFTEWRYSDVRFRHLEHQTKCLLKLWISKHLNNSWVDIKLSFILPI